MTSLLDFLIGINHFPVLIPNEDQMNINVGRKIPDSEILMQPTKWMNQPSEKQNPSTKSKSRL